MFNPFPIEDSVGFRSALVDILRTHFPLQGATEADSASEGLRKLRQLRSGLIDMDIQPPRENGRQGSRTINLVYEDIVIDIRTSCSLAEYRQQVVPNGIDFSFAKGKNSGIKDTPVRAEGPLAIKSYH